ncbi:hypothetical protein HPB51_024838 [Rhipicephalus microplus]|uniref:THAP-type domain-containing protein n=1 Tax=Rhipicephalus microplus TaxID=6941 RepID=A0A9J6DE19_RHIMP|nr:hypothetical protein HPB51_024838 [Rhipicephalus microplus]
MRYCCVPFCTSSQRKKQPGVSFHKITVETTLREQWLKVISWKNWQQNSTSNYSAVCSLHFFESDFRGNTKRHMLKQGSVPSVFPSYTSYLRPIPPRPQSDTSIAKRKLEPLPIKTASPRACTRTPNVDLRTGPSVVDSATVDCLDASAPETAAANAVTARCGVSGITSEFLEDH